MHVAIRKGNVIIVQTLLSIEGIDINAGYRSGETALTIAEKLNNEELVNILRDAGGVIAKEQVHPPNSAKQLKQTDSDIRHDVRRLAGRWNESIKTREVVDSPFK